MKSRSVASWVAMALLAVIAAAAIAQANQLEMEVGAMATSEQCCTRHTTVQERSGGACAGRVYGRTLTRALCVLSIVAVRPLSLCFLSCFLLLPTGPV